MGNLSLLHTSNTHDVKYWYHTFYICPYIWRPSSPLLCGCYVIECIIFQTKPCNLYPVAKTTGNFICLGLCRNRYILYVHSQLLSIGTTEWVDDSDSQSKSKSVWRSPNQPKGTKTKPVTPYAHGGYKASFEACFVDLGCLAKHNFSTTLLENSKKHHSIAWFFMNSHKASPLGPVSGLAVVVPSLCFQSHSYDRTDCYYK